LRDSLLCTILFIDIFHSPILLLPYSCNVLGALLIRLLFDVSFTFLEHKMRCPYLMPTHLLIVFAMAVQNLLLIFGMHLDLSTSSSKFNIQMSYSEMSISFE